MASMPHAMAAHTLAHPHHHQMQMHPQHQPQQQQQLHQQQQQQHIQLQPTGTYGGPGAPIILKQSPTTYQTIVNHPPHQTNLGVAGTPVATAATTQQNPYGSREIVTVRTPLLYTQQESCV